MTSTSYVVTRTRVSVLLDLRLDQVRSVRQSAEYEALVARGHGPDPMPLYHTAEKLGTHPWILLDIADPGVIFLDPEGVLGRDLEAIRPRLPEMGSRRVVRPDGTWYWDLKPDWRPGEAIEVCPAVSRRTA